MKGTPEQISEAAELLVHWRSAMDLWLFSIDSSPRERITKALVKARIEAAWIRAQTLSAETIIDALRSRDSGGDLAEVHWAARGVRNIEQGYKDGFQD